ncbi:MAG: hypothetical protein ABI204_11375 [Ginsengibacter sp.]
MQATFAEIANSRNLLSFGSRQTVIVSDIFEKIAKFLNSSNISNLVFLDKYLSNLTRSSVSENSLYVSILADNFPIWFAFVTAFRVVPYFEREETD